MIGNEHGIIKRLESVNESDVAQMDSIRSEYLRTVEFRSEDFERDHPEVVPLTSAQRIQAWEDYAASRMVGI